MQEILLQIKYFEWGLSKSFKKLNFIFLSNRILSVCHSYALACHRISLVCTRMPSVCTRMSAVCHSYVLVCTCMSLVCTSMSFVSPSYSYVIRISLVCTHMSSVCHLYVLVCHPHDTRMYSSIMSTYVTTLYLYVISSNINDVIRSVLNFLLFFSQ